MKLALLTNRLQPLLQSTVARSDLGATASKAIQVFAIRVVGAGIAYASMVLMARWLGAYQFGIYAYVSVVAMLLGIAFSSGFNSAGVRFVSVYLARGRRARLSGFLRRVHSLVLLFSLLGALLSAGMLFALRGEVESYYFWPLLLGLLSVPLLSSLNQLESTARGFGFLHAAYIPGYILRPMLVIGLTGGLVLLGWKADARLALCGLAGASLIALAVQAVLVFRSVRRRLAGVKPVFHTRQWTAIALGFLVIDGLRMALDNTDLLLIGQLLDPHSIAIYYALIRTGGLLGFISFSVIAYAVPRFAEIHSTGTPADLQRFVSSVTRMIFWPTLLVAFGLAAFGPFLLSLFGEGFTAGYPTMLVVLGGLVLRTASSPVEYLLNMTGHHRDTIRVYAVAAVANIVLNLALIPTLGIIGAAIASYAAMLGANFWLYRLAQRRIGISAFIVPLGRSATALRGATC